MPTINAWVFAFAPFKQVELVTEVPIIVVFERKAVTPLPMAIELIFHLIYCSTTTLPWTLQVKMKENFAMFASKVLSKEKNSKTSEANIILRFRRSFTAYRTEEVS